MDQLINKLKKEDRQNYLLSKWFQIFYWILTPLYFAFLVVNPDPELTVNDRLIGSFYVLCFVSFAFIFWHMKKSYRQIDYSLPSVVMLEQAAERYKLWQRRTFFALIPLFFASVGLGLTYFDRVNISNPVLRIIVIEAAIWCFIALAFLVGVAIWYVKQKPLRDHALKLLRELQS